MLSFIIAEIIAPQNTSLDKSRQYFPNCSFIMYKDIVFFAISKFFFMFDPDCLIYMNKVDVCGTPLATEVVF